MLLTVLMHTIFGGRRAGKKAEGEPEIGSPSACPQKRNQCLLQKYLPQDILVVETSPES